MSLVSHFVKEEFVKNLRQLLETRFLKSKTTVFVEYLPHVLTVFLNVKIRIDLPKNIDLPN